MTATEGLFVCPFLLLNATWQLEIVSSPLCHIANLFVCGFFFFQWLKGTDYSSWKRHSIQFLSVTAIRLRHISASLSFFLLQALSVCFYVYFAVEDAGCQGRQGQSNREAFDARNILKVSEVCLASLDLLAAAKTVKMWTFLQGWITSPSCWTWLMQLGLWSVNTQCSFFSCGWHFHRPVGILGNTPSTG